MTTADSVTYKEIEGYPGYRVGDDGSVWTRLVVVSNGYGRGTSSILGEQWSKLNPTFQKYLKVSLHRGGKKVQKRVHSLVLGAFVGPRPNGMVACHNDGDPFNNRLSNLRWDTQASNIEDKKKHGTSSIGEKNGRNRIAEDQVRSIIRSVLRGDIIRIRATARFLGVSPPAIRSIVQKKKWLHIWDELEKSSFSNPCDCP